MSPRIWRGPRSAQPTGSRPHRTRKLSAAPLGPTRTSMDDHAPTSDNAPLEILGKAMASRAVIGATGESAKPWPEARRHETRMRSYRRPSRRDWKRGIAQARSAAPPKVGRRECSRAASAGPRRSALFRCRLSKSGSGSIPSERLHATEGQQRPRGPEPASPYRAQNPPLPDRRHYCASAIAITFQS